MSIEKSDISASERELRERIVADAAHSSGMEGLTASPEYRADATAFVAGEIDADELVARTRARYGLAERERIVADAAHSSAMEGLTASAEYRADAAAYAAGEFDVDELGHRTRTRWGLPT